MSLFGQLSGALQSRGEFGGANEFPPQLPIFAPDMVVSGNGLTIVDGQTEPSLLDHTDFGVAEQGAAALSRTFTVENRGNANLVTANLTLPTGFSAPDGLSTTIGPGTSDTFTVTFPTTEIGVYLGEIEFANNDTAYVTPFTFGVRAEVVAAPPPPPPPPPPPSNAPPTGSITSPANGVTITSIPVTVTADLTDADGTVIQARLREDGGYIGTDLAAPWSWTWNPTNGVKTLAIEITDDDFAVSFTPNVVVTVAVPPPPPPPPPPSLPVIDSFTVPDTAVEVGETQVVSWTTSGGAVTSWWVDINGDGTPDYAGTSGNSVTVAFPTAGTFTPNLHVENASGSDEQTGSSVTVSAPVGDTTITKVSVRNTVDTDKTSEIVQFGLPTSRTALGSASRHLKIYDDDGSGGEGTLLSNYQIDNKAYGKSSGAQRQAVVTLVLPNLHRSSGGGAGPRNRKLVVKASDTSPTSGTAIAEADVKALTGYANGLFGAEFDIDGTAYSVTVKDILDGGSTTYSKTELWKCSQHWRQGPVCTEWRLKAAPRNAGTPHEAGDGINVEFHLSAYKASSAAVSGGNPITLVRCRVKVFNEDLGRANAKVKHFYYGLRISRATSLSDATMIYTDQTDALEGLQRFDYPRRVGAAGITLSAATVGTARTIDLASGTWDVDIPGAHITVPGGGKAVVTARTSNTRVTVSIYEAFGATTYATGEWVQQGVGHHYAIRWSRVASIGNVQTNAVAWGDHADALNPTDGGVLQYLNSTEATFEFLRPYASSTVDTTDIDAMRASDGTRRPMMLRGTYFSDTSPGAGKKHGSYFPDIGASGPRNAIGWLPLFTIDALNKYNAAGRRLVFENAEYWDQWQYHTLERLTGTPTNGKLAMHPRADNGQNWQYNYNYFLPGSGYVTTPSWWPFDSDRAHHATCNFIAALLSGEYHYYQSVCAAGVADAWAFHTENVVSGGYGSGSIPNKGPIGSTDALTPFSNNQLRGAAWCMKNALMMAFILPSDTRDELMNPKAHWETHIEKSWAALNQYKDLAVFGGASTGTVHAIRRYQWLAYGFKEVYNVTAPWEMAFLSMSLGAAKYLDLDNANLVAGAQWWLRFWSDTYNRTDMVPDYWTTAFNLPWRSSVTFNSDPVTWAEWYRTDCLISPASPLGHGFRRTPTGTVTINSAGFGVKTFTFSASTLFTNGGSWYVGGYIQNTIPGTLRTLRFKSKTQDFVAGGVLTGATSGATATIVHVENDGTVGRLALADRVGTFRGDELGGEVITGSLGGSARTDYVQNVGMIGEVAQITSVTSGGVVEAQILGAFSSLTPTASGVLVPGPHPDDYDGSRANVASSLNRPIHYTAGLRALKKLLGSSVDGPLNAMLARPGYADGSQDPNFWIAARS